MILLWRALASFEFLLNSIGRMQGFRDKKFKSFPSFPKSEKQSIFRYDILTCRFRIRNHLQNLSIWIWPPIFYTNQKPVTHIYDTHTWVKLSQISADAKLIRSEFHYSNVNNSRLFNGKSSIRKFRWSSDMWVLFIRGDADDTFLSRDTRILVNSKNDTILDGLIM